MWDHTQYKQVQGKISFVPIHELLEAVIPEGGEAEWTNLDEAQGGIKLDLEDWGRRVGVNGASLQEYLPIGLWGDSANSTAGDSLYMLLFTVISGSCRRRFWLCGLNKRALCNCGCSGRCTFDAIWAVLGWMFGVLLARKYPANGPHGS